MPRPPSVSRKLLWSVAVPLVLFFALTMLVLDIMFRNLTLQSQREVLNQQLVALVSAVDSADDGELQIRLQDPDSAFSAPGSGHYAVVRTADSAIKWRSPSLTGVEVDFGMPVAAGATATLQRQLSDGVRLTVLSRGLQWEYSPRRSEELVFSVAASMEPYYEQLWSFRRTIFGWFALMTALLLVSLGWLMRRALEPVRRLEREIGEVERGDRERLGEHYPRELTGVAANLNALLGAERQRIARYRDTLGNLAHGLKTPLALMRTALSQGGDVRGHVDREIDRIAQIVDHQLQRAAAGGAATIGLAPVPVLPVATDLKSAMQKVHAGKGVSVELRVAAEAGFLGDRGDLIELLGNLLDNACKWCRGRVLLQVAMDARQARRLWIRVEDDGEGIAPEDRERILGRGVRVDQRAPGHGLGLAMVSDTVSIYGGTLEIEQSVPLGGACFRIGLPGRRLATAA